MEDDLQDALIIEELLASPGEEAYEIHAVNRLDEALGGSMLLYTKKFPTAQFAAKNITSDGQPLAYGRLTPAAVSGTFTLKGKSVPLSTRTEFEPVIGADGKPRLLIRGAFKIDLRTFNIEGADGPAPARHHILLDLNCCRVCRSD